MAKDIEKLAEIGEETIRKRIDKSIMGIVNSVQIIIGSLQDSCSASTNDLKWLWAQNALENKSRVIEGLKKYREIRIEFVSCGINPAEYDNRIKKMGIGKIFAQLKEYESNPEFKTVISYYADVAEHIKRASEKTV